MASPAFCVLIPTRDRCATLVKTVESCLAQDYDNFQIIVSDNVSTDETADFLASVGDSRLRVIRPPRRLSMTGNFEFSLGAAPDAYLMHLGDDDALMPDALRQVAEIAQETRLPAITSAHSVYYWPSSLDDARRNQLTLSCRPKLEIRSTRKAIKEVIGFRAGYPTLPGTYSSFVHKSVIDRVRGSGRYYRSITPDSYSGFVNAAVIERYAYCWQSFTIAGISARSNGGAHAANRKVGEAVLFEQENDLETHPKIAYCGGAIELVVAEAFLQAAEQCPELSAYPLDIERLCHVALRETGSATYADVANAVAATRSMHGLSSATSRPRGSALRLEAGLVRWRRRLSRVLDGYRRLDCAAYGVSDVLGAAKLASDVMHGRRCAKRVRA